MLVFVRKISLLPLIFLFVSCQFFKRETVDSTSVARVNSNYLYHSEIEDIIPNDASKEDSLMLANNYIQNWIKEHLVLDKAEQNLKPEHRNFEKQIEEYRKSLIIYSYENQLINEILDTNVNDEEISTFYNLNLSNFILHNDIVKVRYVKVNKNAPNIKKAQRLYKSSKPDDEEKLKEYAHQYAEKFHFDKNEWVLFKEIKKELPANSLQPESIKSKTSIIIEDTLFFYFINFIDYKMENENSPLSFEKDNIKNMIINKRKIKMLNQLKKDLFEQASINKDFEIYDKPKEVK